MAEPGPRHGGSELLPLCGLILGLGGMMAAALYWKYRPEVVSAVLSFRAAELNMIGLFTDRYAGLAASVDHADVSRIGLANLYRLGTLIGRIYNQAAAAVLFALAIAVAGWAPRQRFRSKIKSLDALILAQADPVRSSRAFVGRARPVRNPPRGEPPRPDDMSLHPAEWIATCACDGRGRFHPSLARAALGRQLGSLWLGAAGADPHVRCLFAAFALHTSRHREDARAYLGDLATALPPARTGQPPALSAAVIDQADMILRDPAVVGASAAVARRHAYTATAMMGVLENARSRGGVLNPGLFNWLKLIDRGLWYALLLTPNPASEGAGARAHYEAELIAGAALFSPHIETAIDAICAHSHQAKANRRGRG